MLSGEGNVGERWKTTIGLISEKSNFTRAAHFFCTFICRCLARLQLETSTNFLVICFMEKMSYVFSFTFFHGCWFSPCIGGRSLFLILSPPLHNFHVVLPTKKYLLSFLSLALDLCRLFSRWSSLACRNFLFFSLFLLLYIPNLWTWQLIKAKYFRQHWYRNNFGFPFSSLLTLKLSLLYRTPVATRFPAKITLSSIWVAIPVDWVILHWCACGADGRSLRSRSVDVRSRDYQIFLDAPLLSKQS